MTETREHRRRFVEIDRAKIDKEKRTVPLSFSSEEPVQRWDGNEVLSHKAGDYDFSRVNSGNHPLLLGHDEHDPLSQIGVIESAAVDGTKGRAIVRFGNSAKAAEIFQDVLDGIRKNISVGYDRTGEVESNKASDGRITTRYKWEPTHIAIVPVPADTKVGIGRARSDLDQICPECSAFLDSEDDENCPACGADIPERSKSKVDSGKKVNVESIASRMSVEEKQRMRILLDAAPPAAAGGGNPAPAGMTVEAYRARQKQIRDLGELAVKACPHGEKELRAMVAEFETGDEKVSVETVRGNLFEKAAGLPKPAPKRTLANTYNQRDASRYSAMRAILSCEKHDCRVPKDGIEREWHDGFMRENKDGIPVAGFVIPIDASVSAGSRGARAVRDEEGNIVEIIGSPRQQRDLTVGVFNQGGAFVPTLLESTVIEILRNKSVLDKRGIISLAGLTANVTIPRQIAAATAYSLPEQGLTTVSNQAIDQIALVPHRISYQGRFSVQLLRQATVDVEGFMFDDAMKVLALKKDFLGLFGGLNADEPTGIVNQPGISSITFGGAPTFAQLVNMETALAALNADVGKLAYVTSAAARGILKQTAKTLTGATTVVQIALWDGQNAEGDGMINSMTAVASNQILNSIMIFADWSSIIEGIFGGFDVVVDPYTQAGTATRQITIHAFIDYALRHAQSVCVSTDSAAQ